MSSVLQSARSQQNGSLVLEGIDWRTYSRLLRIFAEKPRVRLTYDRGRLEIMSPVFEHDDDGRFLGDFVYVLTDELSLPLKRGGSTTLRCQLRRRGIEADECFWIDNAALMKGKRRLDLRTDPPPDLAIEVDVSRSSLDRPAIYAALKVPEVWRLEGESLTFYVLGPDGTYAVVEKSQSFPLLGPDIVLQFLARAREAGDENPVLREIRQWVRQAKSV